MAGDIVIAAEHLGKSYVIGHHRERERYRALRDVVAGAGRSTLRRLGDAIRGRALLAGEAEEFRALDDVSFEVRRGEVLGIIGRNGAGKSTLLKVLSRITEPSAGRVTIRGRVASLLEVGTGFHPELTGRENIYLNGAILGMTRAEIRRKFDEIVAFAEVEKFLDTPVKRYSSGMYVRLAFAVAAHLEPEILIVDEVLAVGDAEFQRKCLGKMGQVAGEGRTVLFVSHNMGAVRALCGEALLLDKGSIAFIGPTEAAVRRYLAGPIGEAAPAGPGAAHPGATVEIVEFQITDRFGNPVRSISADMECRIVFRARNREQVRGARTVLTFTRSTGEVAFCSTDHMARGPRCDAEGDYLAEVTIPGNLLNAGRYDIHLRIGQPGVRVLHPDRLLGELDVVASGSHGSTFAESWPGAVAPKLDWQFRFGCSEMEEAQRAAS